MILNDAKDIALLNRVGLALFILILKAREHAGRLDHGSAPANTGLREGSEAANGAGPAGLVPRVR